MTAEKKLVVAVNKAGEKSAPIRVYLTTDAKLPKKFVLKLEPAGPNDNGDDQTRIGNFGLGIIVTNGTEYIDEKLKGFRRKSGEDVFIVCEEYGENIASLKSLAQAEEF